MVDTDGQAIRRNRKLALINPSRLAASAWCALFVYSWSASTVKEEEMA